MRILFIVVYVILLPFTVLSQEKLENEWVFKKSKNGIDVYTRMMKGSKFKEYKSISTLNASPEELLAVLLDVENYSEWMANVKTAEIIEENGLDEFYVYSEVKVPWPFDNRDEVTKSVVFRDQETEAITIEVTIVMGFVPEKKGIVRMPSGRGIWIFKPVGKGLTEVYHSFGGDPGGSIPSGIVNMFLVDSPIKTLTGLRKKLSE